MSGNDAALRYDRLEKQEAYLSSCLLAAEPTGLLKKGVPLIIQEPGHETYEFGIVMNADAATKSFWTMLGEKVKRLEPHFNITSFRRTPPRRAHRLWKPYPWLYLQLPCRRASDEET